MLFLDFSVTLVMELENLSINQTLSVIFNTVLYEQLHKGMQYLESSMLIGTLIALSIFNQQGNLVFLRSAGFSPLKIVLISGLGPIILSLALIFLDETLFLDLSKKSNTLSQPIQSAEAIQWEMAGRNLIGLSRLNDKQVQAIQIIEFNDQQRVTSFANYEEGRLENGQLFIEDTATQQALKFPASFLVTNNALENFSFFSLLDIKKRNYSKLRGILIDDRGIIRPGNSVFYRGERVSSLTSGTMSPSIRKGIGMAYLDLNIGESVTVEVRGNHLNGRVVRMPFL